MPLCDPSCAIPSVASQPTVGFGAAGVGRHGFLGNAGFGFGALGNAGFRIGALGYGGSEIAENLGILAGVQPSPINQIPPSEVVVQPPSVVVTLPGPILSASCEPVAVGGNAPCAVSGVGIAGGFAHSGLGHYGLGNRGFLGQRGGYLGSNYSNCR